MKTLNGIVGGLGGASLSGMEKKQLQKVQTALAELAKRLGASQVDAGVVAQLAELGRALTARNYVAAEQLQTSLANSVWAQHRAWLQGTKWLIALAKKHFRS